MQPKVVPAVYISQILFIVSCPSASVPYNTMSIAIMESGGRLSSTNASALRDKSMRAFETLPLRSTAESARPCQLLSLYNL